MADAPGWTLSTDPQRLQLAVIHRWLEAEYWSPRIRADVSARAFANSVVIGAYASDGAQLGVARVVTDQASFAWLCDVYVVPELRGRGVARAMVAALLADPRMATVRRWCLATRDAHEVYRPLGFTAVDASRWMERLSDPATWQAAQEP